MGAACAHARAAREVIDPATACADCLEQGTTWSQLRQCLGCGRTLCCDTSPGKHMSGHAAATGHALMRVVGSDESWAWCFVDEIHLRTRPDGTWESYDPFLEAGLWFAEHHLAAGGHPTPGETYVTPEGFPLGRWFAHAGERRAAGDLDPAESAALDALPRAVDATRTRT